MKYAADFRREAREGLKGRWPGAILAGILVSILGGGATGSFSINIDKENVDGIEGYLSEIANSDIGSLLMSIGAAIFSIALITSVAFFILGSIIDLGYAKYNLAIVDKDTAGIGMLFSYFPRWKTAILSRLLQTVYVFLWTLLFIIPGIIAMYRYAMTSYIIAEDENIGANDAITKSKEMMIGNKGRLFCLEFSFIGWSILAAFTCGIGYLWLTPYMNASYAAFYREVSGTGAVRRAAADGIDLEVENDGPTSVIYDPNTEN